MPTLAELMRALPEEAKVAGPGDLLQPLAAASLRPIPVGRLRRMGLMGTLQAKIATIP